MEKEKGMPEEITIGSFPGFKFSPTEEELIQYYLKKKIEGFDKCVDVIAQVDLTLFEPWDLPAKSVIQSDNEWFFFSARGRKYPRGLQSRRATVSGYWKATGKERNVKTGSTIIGTKRTLVFHKGRAPKGERTEWIMHEYCMNGTSQDSLVVCRLRRNTEFHSHDTPRKESRNSSPGESSTSALADGLQNKGFDGRYWEPSSNGNSHFVELLEHNNSKCESDRKLANEICQDGCSVQKDCDGTDDCFADILKDDIIKLDECSVLSNVNLLPPAESTIGIKFKEPGQRSMPSTQPCQGTASRRIRIWMAKEISSHTNQGGSEVGDEGTQKYSPRCLMSTLSSQLSRHHSFVLLTILTLLVLFLLCWHDFGKSNILVINFGSKNQ